jgi:replication-associated recombination protein RarA
MFMPYFALGPALWLLDEFPLFDDLPLSVKVRDELRPIAEGKITEDILFYGKNGVGKTALATLLPCWFHKSRGEEPGLHFLNAMKNLSIKAINDRICLSSPNSEYGWIVLDELDKTDIRRKQQGLLPLFKKYYHRSFIVTANRLADLDLGILNRCHCIEVVPPGIDDLLPYAQKRLHKAGKNYDDDFLREQIGPFADNLRDVDRNLKRLAL